MPPPPLPSPGSTLHEPKSTIVAGPEPFSSPTAQTMWFNRECGFRNVLQSGKHTGDYIVMRPNFLFAILLLEMTVSASKCGAQARNVVVGNQTAARLVQKKHLVNHTNQYGQNFVFRSIYKRIAFAEYVKSRAGISKNAEDYYISQYRVGGFIEIEISPKKTETYTFGSSKYGLDVKIRINRKTKKIVKRLVGT